MSDRVLVGWTQAEIDAALVTAKLKRDAALATGRLAEAEDRERWMDRLLDARPFHRASPQG